MSPGPACRVAVTGVGAVSAWGYGAEALWTGLCSGETAVRPMQRFANADYPTHIAGEVPEDTPAGLPRLRRLPYADRFAVWAAIEAVQHARLPADLSASDRYWVEDIIDPPVTLNPDGTVDVPTRPGIGVSVHVDIIEQFTEQKLEI